MSGVYFEGDLHVSTYNQFRPNPPKKLVQEIIRFTSVKFSGPLEMAVDVGCGSGQSTEVFAPFFNTVLGIDSSSAIIKEASAKRSYSNIFYRQASSDNLPVDNESVNLVSVCQSIHWFELSKFYEEVNRVLFKNGVLAVYGYQLPVPLIEDAKEDMVSIVRKYYQDVLGDFVLPESRKVYLENYSTKEFNEVPFIDGGKMQRFDNFFMDTEGNINDLMGYITSWSTYQNYAKHVGEEKAQDVLQNFRIDFNSLLKENANQLGRFKIRYNYFLLLGRKA